MTSFVIDDQRPEALMNVLLAPRDDLFQIETLLDFMPRFLEAYERIGHPIAGAEDFLSWFSTVDFDSLRSGPPRGKRGIHGECPQYAAMLHLASRQVCDRRLDLAAALAYYTWRWRKKLEAGQHEHAQEDFDSRQREAWRAVRLVSDQAVRLLPHPAEKGYAAKLEKFTKKLDQRRVKDTDPLQLQLLVRFCTFYYGEGREIIRLHGSQRRTFTLEAEWLRGDADPQSEVDVPIGRCRTVSRAPKDLHATPHVAAGNAPEEVIDEPLLLEVKDCAKPRLQLTYPELIRRTRPAKSAMQRANALLPDRWDALNDYDVLSLLRFAMERGLPHEDVSRALVLLSLITGRDLADAAATRVVGTRAQLPITAPGSNMLFIIHSEAAWAVSALVPPKRRSIDSEWGRCLEASQGWLHFRIPAPFWCVIEPLARDAARRSRKKSAKIFVGNIEQAIVAELGDRLAELKKRTGARLTLLRVARQLYTELLRVCGDTAQVGLITGRHPPLGQSANLYYLNRRVTDLSELYHAVMERWTALIQTAPASSAPIEQLSLEAPRVGSKLRVRHEVMRDVIRAIRQQLQIFRKSIAFGDTWRRCHNLLTAYSQLMVMWGTGYRAVRDPLSHDCDFNATRGALIINDKSGEGFEHSRVVWLPQIVAAQLTHYQRHREAACFRLGYVAGTRENPWLFAYLSDDDRWKEATPKQMTEQLDWAMTWPLNTNRHVLRSYLTECGVSGDVVDAFMGHWSMGSEPWGKYSALDPMYFKAEVLPHIERLLSDLGFGVEEGIA